VSGLFAQSNMAAGPDEVRRSGAWRIMPDRKDGEREFFGSSIARMVR